LPSILGAGVGAGRVARDLPGRLPATATITPTGVHLLPNFTNFLADFLPVPSFIALLDNRFFPSLGSAATVPFLEGGTTEPVGRASQDGGLGAAGAPGVIALVRPSHTPTPATTPMDFTQALLWQRAPMEPLGGAAKRRSLGRLSSCLQVPSLWQPQATRLLLPWIPQRLD
jgi:hypothetical protein